MSETRIPLHTRPIRMDAVRVSDSELEVTSHLVDDRPEPEDWFGVPSGLVIHDMRVTLRMRHPDLMVTAGDPVTPPPAPRAATRYALAKPYSRPASRSVPRPVASS
jgi:hypothetical protein